MAFYYINNSLSMNTGLVFDFVQQSPIQCPIYVPNISIHHMYIYKFKFLYIIPFSAIIVPIMLMLRSFILNTLILDTAPIPPSFTP